VDLPTPSGPTTATALPRAIAQRHIAQRRHRAILVADAAKIDGWLVAGWHQGFRGAICGQAFALSSRT
jgi:hypothetical protein